jgi:hypothetical protein
MRHAACRLFDSLPGQPQQRLVLRQGFLVRVSKTPSQATIADWAEFKVHYRSGDVDHIHRFADERRE